ncbi:MAG: hypothetical protein ABW168_25375 [Sedimenticola sp.]
MTEQNRDNFSPGDIILHQGEAYQVYENLGVKGRVAPFPGDDVELIDLEWDDHCRKIGNEPLPAPTPCSTGGCCPSNK